LHHHRAAERIRLAILVEVDHGQQVDPVIGEYLPDGVVVSFVIRW
jgi:hypothetical protein